MKSKWQRSLAAFVVSITPSLSFAASLADELGYMLENHPLIKSAQARAESASEDAKVRSAGYLPTVVIGAEAGWEDQERPNGIEEDLNPDSAIISIRQLLWDFGATSGSVNAGKILEERAAVNQERVRQDLLLAGVQAYFNLVLAEEQVVLAVESEQRVADKRDIEKRKLDAGRGSQADVLQAETQQLGAHARVVQARGGRTAARNTYLQVFGKPAPQYGVMDKEGAPVNALPADVQAAIDIAVENDPALRAARLASDAAHSEVKVAKSAYYPRFELKAEAEYRDDSDGIEGKIEENRVMVRMDYDFDLGFSKRNAVASARARQVAASYSSAHQERVTKESVQNAWEDYETALKRQQVAATQVEKASEFLELAEQERDLGKRTLQDILSGELIRLNAKTAMAQARVDVTVAAYAIMRAMGRLEASAL